MAGPSSEIVTCTVVVPLVSVTVLSPIEIWAPTGFVLVESWIVRPDSDVVERATAGAAGGEHAEPTVGERCVVADGDDRLPVDRDARRRTLERDVDGVVGGVGEAARQREVDEPARRRAVADDDQVGEHVDDEVLEVGGAVVVEHETQPAGAGLHDGVDLHVGVVRDLLAEVGQHDRQIASRPAAVTS